MNYGKHLAIDVGASSGRAIVGWLKEGKIITREIHRFETGDLYLIDRQIRDLYRWYYEIVKAIRIYVKEYGSELDSIGVDAMGSDFILLDEDGNVLRLPLSYRDTDLNYNVYDLVEKNYGARNIYKIAGNQAMICDTLHQLIRLVESNDFSMKRASGILFLGDSLHYLLCGSKCTEHSLASYGRIFNQEKNNWEDSILDAFHIPRSIKSPIVYCGETIGKLHRHICIDVGLSNQPDIITPCTHDTACAALTVPDDDEDWLFISSGSWSLMGMETKQPILSEEAFLFNASNSTMPFRTNMFKKIITGMWIIQRCQKEWSRYSFSEIVRMAMDIKSNQLYLDPDHVDFYSPHNMSKAICDNIKANYGTEIDVNNAALIARIFFESLALKYKYCAEKLIEISNKKMYKIYILGGGSKNELINQFTANATGLVVCTGIEEASATGNLLCQMYGSGELTSKQEIKDVLKNTFPLTYYKPLDYEEWQNKYEDFQNVLSKV